MTHRPRLVGTLTLATRRTAAALIARHPDLVRQRCRPIACDVATRWPLYDLDDVADTFAEVSRRVA